MLEALEAPLAASRAAAVNILGSYHVLSDRQKSDLARRHVTVLICSAYKLKLFITLYLLGTLSNCPKLFEALGNTAATTLA